MAEATESGWGGRKDLIDKVNGPIQRGIGAGTRIILIGPARVLDGIKGGGKTVKSGGEIKGIEGKGGKSGADGKAGVTDGRSGRSSAAARLLKLEDLRDKTLKLPSETKSQAVKIVDLLLLNPKERIDGKSKPLADALRQLNSRELNIVRMILQQGLKTDFSRFSEKFQSQLLVVFKILLESDYKYRSLNRRLNSPVLADTSSNRELRIVKKPISADPISEQLEVRRRENSLLTRRLTQTRAISAELIGRVKPIPVADSTINFSEHANADEQKNPVDVEYELLNPIDTSLYLDSLRRLGKASNGAVSEQLGPGVRIIASDCFRVDEQGIRISLKLNFEGVWHTVCQYEIYSTDAVRWQFKRNANPVKMKLTLPALQLGAMARREFRSNWRTLCNSYLGLASNAF